MMTHHKFEELTETNPKDILLRVELHFVSPQKFKRLIGVSGVLGWALRFGYHIVHINLHRVFNQWLENFVHHPPVYCVGILEVKQHNPVREQTLASNKDRVLFILLEHRDFIVSRERIHEVKQAMTSC